MYRIISVGWNCDHIRCQKSVAEQTLPNKIHYMRMDGEWLSENYLDSSKFSVLPKMRRGALANIYGILKNNDFADEDVIVIVDLDDQLAHNGVLSIVNATYATGDVLLTHGSYRTLSGAVAGSNGPYKPSEAPRNVKWKASHLRTFKYKLWKHLPLKCLLGRDGQFLPVCADLAIMIPLMELAGHDRIRFIPDVLYVYNDMNPNNDFRVNTELQRKTEKVIRQMAALKRVEAT